MSLWMIIANVARRVVEYCEARADRCDRHIIDLMREVLTSK